MKNKIICLCCGIGFPNGHAPTNRIKLLGKCLSNAKFDFSVYHIGGSPTVNTETVGIFDGLYFEYFPRIVKRSKNSFLRKNYYILGILLSLIKILKESRKSKVIVYSRIDSFIFIPLYVILKLFKIPVVHDIDEWWNGNQKLKCKKKFIRLSRGVLVISTKIYNNVLKLKEWDESKNMIRIPILVDTHFWSVPVSINSDKIKISWCGNILGGARKEISFMMKVLKEAKKNNPNIILNLIGVFNQCEFVWINSLADSLGLSEESYNLTGFLNDEDLRLYYKSSEILLLPIWNDQRSINRFPTKLGEYLACSIPVITSKIGDMDLYLKDDESIIFCKVEDINDWSTSIQRIISKKERYRIVGENGYKVAKNYFDYRNYTFELPQYFDQILTNTH